jgi:N-acetylglucosaminyldiphosphoundecaprenol N-acetyl-beta-D-mannosaminyltransferase
MEKINIGNIPIHLFTVDSLHETIAESIQGKNKILFLHANAHLIELANTTNNWLVDFFSQESTYVMCDGAGIQLAAKLTNQPVPLKIPYNTWIWEFLKFIASRNFSIYFLGADKTTLQKAVEKMKKFEPALKIAGYHNGYFNKNFNHPENQQILKKINDANPDILLVGFGMPIQELWLQENHKMLNAYAIFSCGGAFDFISGKNRVAPYFFRKFYLEWLFRFFLEPVRLFSRITVSNYNFLKLVLKLRKYHKERSAAR